MSTLSSPFELLHLIDNIEQKVKRKKYKNIHSFDVVLWFTMEIIVSSIWRELDLEYNLHLDNEIIYQYICDIFHPSTPNELDLFYAKILMTYIIGIRMDHLWESNIHPINNQINDGLFITIKRILRQKLRGRAAVNTNIPNMFSPDSSLSPLS